MNKLLLLALVLGGTRCMSLAQNRDTYSTKITYRYVYAVDSTRPGDKQYQLMYLFYQDGRSYFQSRDGYMADSSNGRVRLHNSNRYVIIKDGQESITTVEYLPSFYYSYQEPEKLSWKIWPDSMMIGTLLCQKATTSLGGRAWTAWFAPKVPIADGPYKFSGLPGLIIRLEDQQSYFLFTFLRLEHVSTQINPAKLAEAKKTTKQKFFGLRKAYRENPLPFETQNKTFTSGQDEIMQRVKANIDKHNLLIERSIN